MAVNVVVSNFSFNFKFNNLNDKGYKNLLIIIFS